MALYFVIKSPDGKTICKVPVVSGDIYTAALAFVNANNKTAILVKDDTRYHVILNPEKADQSAGSDKPIGCRWGNRCKNMEKCPMRCRNHAKGTCPHGVNCVFHHPSTATGADTSATGADTGAVTSATGADTGAATSAV